MTNEAVLNVDRMTNIILKQSYRTEENTPEGLTNSCSHGLIVGVQGVTACDALSSL
jgi:hypothetical protein